MIHIGNEESQVIHMRKIIYNLALILVGMVLGAGLILNDTTISWLTQVTTPNLSREFAYVPEEQRQNADEILTYEQALEILREDYEFSEIISSNVMLNQHPVVYQFVIRLQEEEFLVEIDANRKISMRSLLRKIILRSDDDD